MALDSELIRKLLPECRRSMMGTRPGFTAYGGWCLAEALARETGREAELLLPELESWVVSRGGAVERRPPPVFRGLRPGGLFTRDRGPPIVVFWLAANL